MKHNSPVWANASPVTIHLSNRRNPAPDYSCLFLADGYDVESCVFCGHAVVVCTFSNGEPYSAPVVTDEDGKRRFDLVNPHHCEAERRFEQSFDSPESEEADAE